jgi:hypothetical protein
VVELALRDARPDLEHTYRHDLESCFYVFLAVCISHGWIERKRPRTDPPQDWYIGGYKNIAVRKRGAMERCGFRSVLTDFCPKFAGAKELAWELRDLLFLCGELRTGTPAEPPAVLYGQMISSFDKAIESWND